MPLSQCLPRVWILIGLFNAKHFSILLFYYLELRSSSAFKPICPWICRLVLFSLKSVYFDASCCADTLTNAVNNNHYIPLAFYFLITSPRSTNSQSIWAAFKAKVEILQNVLTLQNIDRPFRLWYHASLLVFSPLYQSHVF